MTEEERLLKRLEAAIEKQAPAVFFITITPHNTNEVDSRIRTLFISEEGTVVAEDQEGNEVTFTLDAGTLLPIRPKFIKAASTATVIGLW